MHNAQLNEAVPAVESGTLIAGENRQGQDFIGMAAPENGTSSYLDRSGVHQRSEAGAGDQTPGAHAPEQGNDSESEDVALGVLRFTSTEQNILLSVRVVSRPRRMRELRQQCFNFTRDLLLGLFFLGLLISQWNLNTGREDFIRAGGESNPGPPRRRPQQPNARPNPAAAIPAAVNNFRLTQVYLRGRDKTYPDAQSLGRFNAWVQANIQQIDPAECSVCATCGDADLILCAHHIAPAAAAAPPPPPPPPAYHWTAANFLRPLYHMFTSPVFNFGGQNNQYIGYLGNEQISDREIIPDLYNYITLNQQTSYVVNGKDARDLRLSHSHRLAHRWAEATKRSDELVRDTVLANRFKFTIQRACDQQETNMLYGYTNPSSNFGLAWLPTSWVIFWLIAAMLSVCLFLLGKVFIPVLAPKLAELAVWHYMGSLRTVLLTVKAGSVQLFWSLTALLSELLAPLLGVLRILSYALFNSAWDLVYRALDTLVHLF